MSTELPVKYGEKTWKELWDFLESVNWAKGCKERFCNGYGHEQFGFVHRTKKKLMREHGRVKCLRARACSRMLLNLLESRIKQEHVDVQGVGDDGYGDLKCHILGLGRRIFMAAVKNPKLVAARAKAGKYRENFLYCLPYEDDFESLDNKEKHQLWARKAAVEIGARDLPLIVRQHVIRTLEHFAETGMVEKFLQQRIPVAKMLEQFHGAAGYSALNLFNDVDLYLNKD